MKRSFLVILGILIFGGCLFAEQLTLSQALDLSLQNNRELQSAQLKVEQAKANITQVWATVLPSLNLQSGYTKVHSYLTGTEYDLYANSLKLNQLVFSTYALSTIDAADLAYKIALDEYELARQTKIYEVISSFYAVLKAKQLRSVSQKSVVVLKGHLYKINEMKKVGLVTNLDRLKVEIRVREVQNGFLQADKYYQLAQLQLESLLGGEIEEKAKFDLVYDEKKLEFTLKPGKAYLVKALEQRSDYLMLLKIQKLLAINENVVKGSRYPVAYLAGVYGYIDTTSFKFAEANKDWSMTLSVSMPIFNGGAISARIKNAELERLKAAKNIEIFRQGLILQIREAVLSLNIASAKIQDLEVGYDLARQSLQEAKEKFRLGAGTNQDILDGELALRQAESSLISGKFEITLSKYKLKKVMGEL
jgi:outer membrane protein